MTAALRPYLNFPGNAREAFEFYGEDSDEQRLTAIFDALADGGTVTFPLGKQVWGGIYGAVTDRFGIFWQINIGG
ncbi:MAG: hypothetical protein DI634_04365 [Kocuria palustris]|nr:MAG: hypothetical protein DI634_04365 [Kocuria palustris]